MPAPPITDNQRLLSPEQTMEYLGVTARGLRTLRESGKLTPVKWGHRTLRYDKTDLDALIREWKGGSSDA